MANRCEDEFNPWPSFVDIFSSVILVLLLFLLVILVNLGFYAQFKYKVSYTGSISSDDLILNDNPVEVKIKEETVETKSKKEAETTKEAKKIIQVQAELAKLRKIIKKEELKKGIKGVISGGVDVYDVKDDDNKSEQTIILNDEYIIVTFKENEMFLDNSSMKQIQSFIKNIKDKYKIKKIIISAYDIKGQVSATITKQISLARSIGTRNLIRKMGYNKKDVRINLRGITNIKEKIKSNNGYIVVRVKKQ